ncbi:MAG: glutamate racemase [Flavobacteriales bacterium]
MSKNPIGIFDSGIGGLTIAHAIKKKLPNESLIYFGDTKHLPYGEKSEQAIKDYSLKIAEFLKNNNCKAIIIACNSASSAAYYHIKKNVNSVPIYNVIDPIISFISKKYFNKKIGVIGTKATIQSGVYKNKILEKNSTLKVASLETPLLAPMIEEGFFNQEISSTIIKNYFNDEKLDEINVLVLACTHYPLIQNEIKKFYNEIDVIDSSEIVAEHINKELSELNLLNRVNKPKFNFIISNFTESFSKSANIFFKENISLEENDIWKSN